MRSPSLRDLPAPRAGLHGWPWTVESPQLPDALPDGTPWPRISIVIASLNQPAFIEKMLRSALLQGYPDVELILEDGGSRDETLAIIRRYEPWITYWISEPDRGQSHAFNKGFAHATGSLVNIFDTDDYFTPGAFGAIGAFHARQPECLIACDVIRTWEGTMQNEVYFPENIDLRGYVQWWKTYHHGQPGLFYPRALLDVVGPIDEDLHYLMDYEWTLRFLAHTPMVAIGVPAAVIYHNAACKSIKEAHNFILDLARVSAKQYVTFPELEAEGNRHMSAALMGTGMGRLSRGHTDGWRFVREALATHAGWALYSVFPGWFLRRWRAFRRTNVSIVT